MKRSKKTAPIEQAGMCAFFEAVPEAALILDRDGAIIAANTTAARRMGLDDPLDLRGKNVLDSLPKEVAEHRREMIRQAVATGEAMRFEDEHDGRIESHVLSPILDEDGRVVSLAASITDITEFRRAGEELRREQQRQIFLMEFLPGFVFVLAQDHTIRYANRYFRRYFGSPKGKRCHEIFRKSSTPCASCAPANVFRSERPTQWEWTNADNRTFQIHSHPMTDVDGSLVAVILGMDITARKLAEDELRRAHDELEVRVEQRTSELRRSESRYRAVVEDQSELICRFGDDRRITFANRAFCRFFGRQDEEMSGRPFLPEVVDDDLPVLESLLESLSAQSPLKMDDFRVVAPSGETRWIRWTVRAVVSESGELTEYQAVGRDITARKKAEQRYFDLIQSLPIVVFALADDFQLEFINKTCADLLGFTPEEALSAPNWLLAHVEDVDREAVKAFFQCCFQDRCDTPESIEFHFQHKNGYLVHLQARRIHQVGRGADRARRVEGIIVDVTEREFLDKVLVQKEKLDTLGAMSAELAHEMRNPLMPLAGFAKRLQQKHPELAETEIILENARRLEELLDRIKDHLQPVQVTRNQCRINPIVTFCADRLASRFSRQSQRLRLDLDPNLPPLMSDPDLLTQIFLNLINNAASAMPESGLLTIKTFETKNNLCVEFTIAPKAIRELRLEILSLAPEQDKGNVGLALSYRLTKNVGGYLSVEEDPEATVFTVYLPKEEGPGRAGP